MRVWFMGRHGRHPRPGVVKVVNQVFDAASSTFGVRVEIGNTDRKLPAGHRCKVTFAGVTD